MHGSLLREPPRMHGSLLREPPRMHGSLLREPLEPLLKASPPRVDAGRSGHLQTRHSPPRIIPGYLFSTKKGMHSSLTLLKLGLVTSRATSRAKSRTTSRATIGLSFRLSCEARSNSTSYAQPSSRWLPAAERGSHQHPLRNLLQHPLSRHLSRLQHLLSRHLPRLQHPLSRHLPRLQHLLSRHLPRLQHPLSRHLCHGVGVFESRSPL
jgi:hypothetical protein